MITKRQTSRYLAQFFLLIAVLFSLNLKAQKSEIGINTAYGKTVINERNTKLISPFGAEDAEYMRFGVCYFYTAKNAFFTLNTGLNYDQKWEEDLRLHYLKTPLGVDFNFGKKFQFIIGAGLTVNYLLGYSGFPKDGDFDTTKNRFQISGYANSGIGFQLSETYNLSLKYLYCADLTNLYQYERWSPGGAAYQNDIKSYDGSIVLCLKYRL